MASESEQGHVGCTAKRRTRLARPAFVGRSVKSLTNSNRRIRNRTYGGVGGADERLSPYPDRAVRPTRSGQAPATQPSNHIFIRTPLKSRQTDGRPQKTMVCLTASSWPARKLWTK